MKNSLLLIFMLCCTHCIAQETFDLSFLSNKKEVYGLTKGEEKIITVEIAGKNIKKFAGLKYTFSITADKAPSNIKVFYNNKTAYKKSLDKFGFDSLVTKETVYISVIPDSVPPQKTEIEFKLVVRDSANNIVEDLNTANFTKIVITLYKNAKQEPLKDYKYLSYIGTNFDLVDKIKAENIFFATNIFSHPVKDKTKVGFYLSLYGNRTMSVSEDLGVIPVITEIIPQPDGTSIRLQKHVQVNKSTTSDNLGAHFSTLHPIFGTKGDVRTYFTLSAEFIWKRTNITTTYGDVSRTDTLSTSSTGIAIVLNDLQEEKTPINEYSFQLGPGIMLSLENSDLSVRVHGAAGYASNYYITESERQSLHSNTPITTERSIDVFFSGRAWITEPKTGITLQAEITNRLENPRLFYAVTLSKAFKLDELAGFFSPVTSQK